jgi:TM2 domain-containing membrane protein YozV
MKKEIKGWQGIEEFINTIGTIIFLILVSIFAVIWAIFIMIKATGYNVKEFFIKKFKK